ncbi:V-type proton ATPase subunit c2 [Camellia lanceoleosa]|uniref:V-type proton ATPase subunit c2 n=1 Tax=Camellia lanceoleosa TaxID=1840588 RepID=A0ACC0F3G0_9ERIC|nr:V-type proton ATPase subunit c2 [Camellia lanceoleosa]
MASTFSGDETAPFFGFLGTVSTLVFSCNTTNSQSPLSDFNLNLIFFFFFFFFFFFLFLDLQFLYMDVFFRYGGCVWDSEEWRWSGVNGCDKARACDEVDCSSGYGWCVGYLWIDYCCDHLSKVEKGMMMW